MAMTGEVVVGIETDRGLWVHALVAAGYPKGRCNLSSVEAWG